MVWQVKVILAKRKFLGQINHNFFHADLLKFVMLINIACKINFISNLFKIYHSAIML